MKTGLTPDQLKSLGEHRELAERLTEAAGAYLHAVGRVAALSYWEAPGRLCVRALDQLIFDQDTCLRTLLNLIGQEKDA